MAFTAIRSESRPVHKTSGDRRYDTFGWDSIYAHNDETFGGMERLDSETQWSTRASRLMPSVQTTLPHAPAIHLIS
jgi:hypothetical protein